MSRRAYRRAKPQPAVTVRRVKPNPTGTRPAYPVTELSPQAPADQQPRQLRMDVAKHRGQAGSALVEPRIAKVDEDVYSSRIRSQEDAARALHEQQEREARHQQLCEVEKAFAAITFTDIRRKDHASKVMHGLRALIRLDKPLD
jgi:hypothetical protein